VFFWEEELEGEREEEIRRMWGWS